MMWPFKWKLSACTFTCYYLFLKILENEMWKFGRNLPLATFGSEKVKFRPVATYLRFEFKLWFKFWNWLTSFEEKYKTVSSAYKVMLQKSRTSGISFIYIKNISGPRMEPCASPTYRYRSSYASSYLRSHTKEKYLVNQARYTNFYELLSDFSLN